MFNNDKGRLMRPFALSKKWTILAIGSMTLMACDSPPPEPPICRISDAHLDDTIGNAGCFIRINNKLLTTGNRKTGKLDTPGGTANEGEIAQCTAHRETFEETGFNVEVGQLLGVADNGYRIYQCIVNDEFDEDIDKFPVPGWANSEIDYIKLTDPFDTLASEWRYPKRHLENLAMFDKTDTSNE